MPGRVAVVTGGNKGIGFATVRKLCQDFDGTIYLTARDEARGKAAVEQLAKEGLRASFAQLDVANASSRQAFHDRMKELHGGIDVLINNAGIAFSRDAKDPFGVQAEATMATNYYAMRDLCDLIFPLLRKHARVVNVSSSAGHLSQIRGDGEAATLRKKLGNPEITQSQLDALADQFVNGAKDGTHTNHGWPSSAYSISKVLVSVLTRIQQREVDKARPQDDIIVNCVHPGYVDTDMTKHRGRLSPDESAKALVYLALLPEDAKDPRGKYIWHDCSEVEFTAPSMPAEY